MGFDLSESLTLEHQVAVAQKGSCWGSSKCSKMSKFIDRECMLKLVYCLFITQTDFCNSVLYGKPNADLCSLHKIQNVVQR